MQRARLAFDTFIAAHASDIMEHLAEYNRLDAALTLENAVNAESAAWERYYAGDAAAFAELGPLGMASEIARWKLRDVAQA